LTHCLLVVWAADDKVFHIELVRVTHNHCPSFMVNALSHTPLCITSGSLELYNELYPHCLYADTKTKENLVHYF